MWDSDPRRQSGTAGIGRCVPFSARLHTRFHEALAIPMRRWIARQGDLVSYQSFTERMEARVWTAGHADSKWMASLRLFGQVVDSGQNASFGLPQSACRFTPTSTLPRLHLRTCHEKAWRSDKKWKSACTDFSDPDGGRRRSAFSARSIL